MAQQTSRRKFLGLSALGMAAAAVPSELVAPVFGASEPAHPPSNISPEISVWVTSTDERFATAPRATWQPASQAPAVDHLRLNPSTKFQQILGFGGAFTDAACYTFNQMAAGPRENLFHELFHPSEMGLSTGRICVGSSDYSTKLYSYDDGDADPELKRFSIEHDREYILPVLRQARRANPDLFLFSSPCRASSGHLCLYNGRQWTSISELFRYVYSVPIACLPVIWPRVGYFSGRSD